VTPCTVCVSVDIQRQRHLSWFQHVLSYFMIGAGDPYAKLSPSTALYQHQLCSSRELAAVAFKLEHLHVSSTAAASCPKEIRPPPRPLRPRI
jgi:hypothetical protein